MYCAKCNRSAFVKSGKLLGKQRLRCKNCGYSTTKPLQESWEEQRKKEIALQLVLNQVHPEQIAEILEVSTATVYIWKASGAKIYNNMLRRSALNFIELDRVDAKDIGEYFKLGKHAKYGVLTVDCKIALVNVAEVD